MGEKHGIKKTTIGLIVDEVADAANNFQTYAKTAGVSKTTLKKINAIIKQNLNGFSRASGYELQAFHSVWRSSC